MNRVYRVDQEYRDKGKNYREVGDQFRSWITDPIPEEMSNFPDDYRGQGASELCRQWHREYAVFILISKEEDEIYPDEIDRAAGEIRYWGDAKREHPN